jgi:peptidoglycan/LPS O-acetylase OafA/YrhL
MLNRLSIKNNFSKDYGDTKFITGMRAFAALAVVLIHAGGAGFRELGVIGNNVADLGRTGVYAFFVISGFSVALSYDTSKNYSNYINKRLWRIVPLYYFWLIMAVIFEGISTALLSESKFSNISLYNWALHLLFLGFIDYTVTNSIIGVEWSISIEVFWYFLIPFFVNFCRTSKSLILILILSFVFYILSQKYAYLLPVKSENALLAMHWSPIPYFFSFMLGMAAYIIRLQVQRTKSNGDWAIGFVIFFLMLHISAPTISNLIFFNEFILISLITGNLLIWGSEKSSLIKVIFCNPIVQFLGVISYGVYLSHFPVMGLLLSFFNHVEPTSLLLFIMVAGFSVIISAITYLLIERKFNLFGIGFGVRYL